MPHLALQHHLENTLRQVSDIDLLGGVACPSIVLART